MLRILYGTAGTGKSAAIMDEIRRGADSGERYILLVPEQYSHEAERELCAVCGDGLSLYAEVLSFTGLAREISSECGGAANEYLDKGGRLLCWHWLPTGCIRGCAFTARRGARPSFKRCCSAPWTSSKAPA